jgi:hypothetical protein
VLQLSSTPYLLASRHNSDTRVGPADHELADPLVLEFDHLGLKRKNVMTMVWEGYSMETIENEMSKCDIRCANCHRRKTLAERNSFRHRAGQAS